MLKIKRQDEVVVTAGKDKGKRGKVERVMDGGQRVVVSGVNMYKKHQRAKAQTASQQAGIIDIHRPLPIANVALICPECNTQTRVGFAVEKGQKRRMCKKCHGVFA